jgi:PKD repeat protein
VTNPVNTQFTASPLSGYGPLTVTFTDQSVTTYGTLNSWQWSFGDSPSASTQQNPTHVYSHIGAYTVRLTTGTGVYNRH